jgi:hypothetical protein
MCIGTYVYSREKAIDVDIVTDRPDVTESSIVIPNGSFQLENGFTWKRDQGGTSWISRKLRFGSAFLSELSLGSSSRIMWREFLVARAGRVSVISPWA